MRILLVNSNLKDDFLAAPPIGLCYIAGATEDAGHETRVVDLCFRKNVKSELGRAIKGFSPDVVGISIRNIDNANMLHEICYVPEAEEIVRHVRSLTDARIVIGGSGASLSPARILERLGADFVIVSEGERSFVELLDRIERWVPADDVPGVGLMADGRFHLTPPQLADFAGVNPRVGRWIDLRPYQKMGSSYNVQSKRGCRQRCIYCTYNQVLEGSRLRLRSPVEVVDEIEEAVYAYNPESFDFVDSVFNDPYDHCVEILEEIVRRPWKTSFTTMGVSPKNIDLKFLELMWKAGFHSFMITPEAASETMIRNYGKGFSIEDVVKAAEAVRKTRHTALWYFLIGGPGETNETLQETIDFTKRYLSSDTRPPYSMANYFLGVRIYPNTKLWSIARREGFIHDDSDPLMPLWYISEDLDVDRAVEQMIELAKVRPEVMLGFDEKYTSLSRMTAFFGELLHMDKPYWRHIWGLNQLLMKTRLRFVFKPPNIADRLRSLLERQGYRGPLLEARKSIRRAS